MLPSIAIRGTYVHTMLTNRARRRTIRGVRSTPLIITRVKHAPFRGHGPLALKELTPILALILF